MKKRNERIECMEGEIKGFFKRQPTDKEWCMTSSKNSSTVLVSQFSEWVREAGGGDSAQPAERV